MTLATSHGQSQVKGATMNHEHPKEECGRLLDTPEGKAIPEKELSEMFKKAMRKPQELEHKSPSVRLAKEMAAHYGGNAGVVDWSIMLRLVMERIENNKRSG